MKSFKDLGIKPACIGFTGDKVSIDRILNREIIVHQYKIEASKFEGRGNCLHMQIGVGEELRVVFTGSNILMDAIKQVPKNDFPFKATIVKENKRYEFQ